MKKILSISLVTLLLFTGCATKKDVDVAQNKIEVNQEKDVKIEEKIELENEVEEVEKENETDKIEEIKDEVVEDKKVQTVEKVKENKRAENKEAKKVTRESAPRKLSPEEVANKVMQGHYGNGSERKARLEQEGYNYNEIQKIISQKMPKKKESTKAVETNTNTNNNNNNNASNKTQARTDGFNFKGYHFSIANFSGSGSVPKETNNVYSWTTRPSHYLVERISPAGRVIRQVKVGDKVVINGQSYKVHKVRSGIPNDNNSYDVLTGTSAHITFQTCDTTKGANGNSNLTIWWANKE